MNYQSRGRRDLLKALGVTSLYALGIPSCRQSISAAPTGSEKTSGSDKPNIILVLTDDQDYGEVGYNGNPVIQTPNLDKFARENVEFTQFYASPCCTPTRAALMTGRDPYRLNVPWVGHPLHPNELALSEALKAAGYATGCFGKWGNLGVHYPLRAVDRGFDYSVVHRKGQFSPPHNKTAYFDPILQVNGEDRQFKGYCNDIWFDEAEQFIEHNRKRPFFIYLPTNLPHLPAQVPKKYSDPYKGKLIHDQAERVYGMITHIDERFGRLMDKLDRLGIRDNTIVIFLSDNGGVWLREQNMYKAGLRGKKGMIYEGGIRVPCVMSWSKRFRGGKIDRIAEHIDIMPTLLEAAGIRPQRDVRFDGISLLPLLTGRVAPADWPDRTLIMQGYPEGKPQIRRCFIVRNQRYKLVQGYGNKFLDKATAHRIPEDNFKYELFDMDKDPGENHDISAQHPKMAEKMKRQYEEWFREVSTNPGFTRERAVPHIGSGRQKKVWLETYGAVKVKVIHEGRYRVTLEPFGVIRWAKGDVWDGIPFKAKSPGKASFKWVDVFVSAEVSEGADRCVFEDIFLPIGEGHFEAKFMVGGKKVYGGRNAENQVLGPLSMIIERLD